jgi:hypothetical protein
MSRAREDHPGTGELALAIQDELHAERADHQRALRCRLAREADGGTRTPDPIITSDVLYQLSYVGAVRVDGSDRSGA